MVRPVHSLVITASSSWVILTHNHTMIVWYNHTMPVLPVAQEAEGGGGL